MFYLGNSYKDSCQYEKAIEVYKKRIQQGGWMEETWICHYNTGFCFKALGRMAEAYRAWIDAIDVCPERIENLYEIIYDSRLSGKNHTAFYFYEIAKRAMGANPQLDFLFTQADVYHWKLDFEFTIVAFYIPAVMELCNRPRIINTCMNLMALPFFPKEPFQNVLYNYKFYVLPLPIIDKWKTPTLTLQGNQTDEFINSTPSIETNVIG
jgi:tetratricopeptide (TPR) repeat protein